jgi:hypothetical protein
MSQVEADQTSQTAEAELQHESSLYHVFVALGFSCTEIGLFFGRPGVATVGLSVFGWSLVGILRETTRLGSGRRGRQLATLAGTYLTVAVLLSRFTGSATPTVQSRSFAFGVAAAVLLVHSVYVVANPSNR